jgi:hypothetical protein
MSDAISELVARIRELEGQLEVELATRRVDLNYRIEEERIIFEEDAASLHRKLRTTLRSYIKNSGLLTALTAPFIYAVAIPFVLLDVFVTTYHAVCFPVYGIQKVRRRDYIMFDRQHLCYLNYIEKLNCAYCSYGNGLIAYVSEIVSRTEQYWCPIKHARRVAGAHRSYLNFVDYGDAGAYHQHLEGLRQHLQHETRNLKSEEPKRGS